MLPKIFYYMRTAKNLLTTAPFMYNFRSSTNKFPTIFGSLIFHISFLRLGYFSLKKGNLKFSDLKIVIERGIRKILSFVIR